MWTGQIYQGINGLDGLIEVVTLGGWLVPKYFVQSTKFVS